MNLLLVNYEYPPIGGGAATATFHLAKRFAALGHGVTVLTAGFGERTGSAGEGGVWVIRCPSRRRRPDRSNLPEMFSFVWRAALALPKVLRERRPEGVVVFFSFPCGPLGLWAWWLAQTPYVVSLRGGDVPGAEAELALWHRLLQPLRRLVFRRSRAVVANSPALKAMSEAADPHPVRLILNGVDADRFCPAPVPSPPAPDRPFAFLFVGRFRRQKNLFFLLEQMACLRSRQAVPFVLHMVGDGPQGEALREAADKAGLGDVLRWHGWLERDALISLYQSSHCLLNPSLYEGMPNAVLEAMACGLPVIASAAPGNDAVVRPGETGFLCPLSDPGAFQEALERVLRDPDLARALGRRGRAWVLRDFSWEGAARAYVRLFEGAGVREMARQ